MLKHIFPLVLALLMLPVLALAESMPEFEVFTFAEALPERLTEPLSSYIPADAHVLSGAAIQHNSIYIEPDEPGSLDAYSALLLVDMTDGLHLIAAAWVDGLPWQVNNYTHLLRRDRDVSITVYQPSRYSVPMFSVDYPEQDGVISDLMLFRGNRLWQLTGHIDEVAGITISVDLGSATVTDTQGQDMYACAKVFWMDYLDSIDVFPTCRAEVETLNIASGSILVSNTAAGRAYTEGAHLRQEPTSESASLGLYNKEVPLTLTGEQKQGALYPWYQVRIGDTVGWMSASYVQESLYQYYPVPVGRTLDGCPMYAALGDSQPADQLAPETTFHILTEINGMYHICIPQGNISWEVDRNGVYGYVPKEGILYGASISTLDALESASK